MPVRVQCPRCKTGYTLGDEFAGKPVQCTQCKQVFQVGRPAGHQPPAQPPAQQTPPQQKPAAPVAGMPPMPGMPQPPVQQRPQQPVPPGPTPTAQPGSPPPPPISRQPVSPRPPVQKAATTPPPQQPLVAQIIDAQVAPIPPARQAPPPRPADDDLSALTDSAYEEAESRGSGSFMPILLGLLVVLVFLAGGGAAGWFFYVQPEMEKDRLAQSSQSSTPTKTGGKTNDKLKGSAIPNLPTGSGSQLPLGSGSGVETPDPGPVIDPNPNPNTNPDPDPNPNPDPNPKPPNPKPEKKILEVVSAPDTKAERGKLYSYQIQPKSSDKKVRFALVDAPKGMEVTAEGKVTWQVPKDLAEKTTGVHVDLLEGDLRLEFGTDIATLNIYYWV
jgi:predicted Zn finger-like uncharacterized protein